MLAGLIYAVLLAMHLLAMNLAVGGPLVSLWLPRPPEPVGTPSLGRSLVKQALWALLLGVCTGGLLLVWPSSVAVRQVWGRLPAEAYWFAGVELIFSAVCLGIAVQFWQPLARRRGCLTLLVGLSSTNLLYHFPPLMSVLSQLAHDPLRAETTATLDRPALLQLMRRAEVLSLVLHFGLAAVAVAAVACVALWARQPRPQSTSPDEDPCRRAAGIGLLATLLQVPVGLWVLIALPASARSNLLSPLASVLFLGGLLATLRLLQRLLKIALGEFDGRDCVWAWWLLVGIVWLMTSSLCLVRG